MPLLSTLPRVAVADLSSTGVATVFGVTVGCGELDCLGFPQEPPCKIKTNATNRAPIIDVLYMKLIIGAMVIERCSKSHYISRLENRFKNLIFI